MSFQRENSTLQEPDTIMNSEVQHLQVVLQSTQSSPLAEGQQAIPWQRGELTGVVKTMVSIWSIFNCMEELPMLFLEGKKRYGRQAVTPCSGANLWSQGHTRFITPSTDTQGITAFVWIQWCQDTKQQGCNFTKWLQESCSISSHHCPRTNAPNSVQGLPQSVTLSTSTLVQLPGVLLLTHSQLCSTSEGCHNSPLSKAVSGRDNQFLPYFFLSMVIFV